MLLHRTQYYYKELEEYMMGIEYEVQCLVGGEIKTSLHALSGAIPCKLVRKFSIYEELCFTLNSHHVFFKIFVPRTH